jgi:hypothetical protein
MSAFASYRPEAAIPLSARSGRLAHSTFDFVFAGVCYENVMRM